MVRCSTVGAIINLMGMYKQLPRSESESMLSRVLGRVATHRLTPVGLIGLGYALQGYAMYRTLQLGEGQ